MQLVDTTKELQEAFASDIPELVWATGPVSYDYHFADRKLFNAVVLGSWRQEETLFAAKKTTLAIEDGQLMGIKIGMPGPEFRAREAALETVWRELVTSKQINTEDIEGLLQRSQHASWLNPVIHSDTYYILAISVKPECRGKRIGYLLMDNAISIAREQGFAKLQLDVLSDNPAVEFYRAVGFELLAETRTPKPSAFGVPPEYRMGMEL
jgi:ribosomal protein S18 acetylase RimI-like enzyme